MRRGTSAASVEVMRTRVFLLILTAVVIGSGYVLLGHLLPEPHGRQPNARDVGKAVRIASHELQMPSWRRPMCHRTDSSTSFGKGVGYESFECLDIQCEVEWGLEIGGQPTQFYDCTRPTGDSFYYLDVCLVGSHGRIAVDAARTAALENGDLYPCPYRSEE